MGSSAEITGNADADAVASAWTPVCRASLVDSYDPERHLFAHQLYEGRWRGIDAIYPHETLTSSAIALLGLHRAGIDPADHGIDDAACLDAIVGEVGRTGYLGGLGLAVWANAVADGRRSALELLEEAGVGADRLVGDLLGRLTTMETAWLASGLLHELHRAEDEPTRRLARAAVDELRCERYRGVHRLMAHAGAGAPTADRLRGHIANFADQIYPVQALAFAGLVLDDAAAAGVGAALADRHCELQGPLGQWWWHHDARRGHVALRYAVYSVHQHGMAPMALAATTAATGRDYRDAVALSRAWIDANESGHSMFEPERGTIWRSLERVEAPVAGRVRGVLEALGVGDERNATVELNRETRPYEWAWCLYAAAIENGLPKGRSLV